MFCLVREAEPSTPSPPPSSFLIFFSFPPLSLLLFHIPLHALSLPLPPSLSHFLSLSFSLYLSLSLLLLSLPLLSPLSLFLSLFKPALFQLTSVCVLNYFRENGIKHTQNNSTKLAGCKWLIHKKRKTEGKRRNMKIGKRWICKCTNTYRERSK